MQLTKEGAEPRGCGSCLSQQGLGGSWWTFNVNVFLGDESQHEALFEWFLAYHRSVELIAKPEHATWRACCSVEEASAKAEGAAEGHLWCAAKSSNGLHVLLVLCIVSVGRAPGSSEAYRVALV
jgi:hypothetical protein